MKEEIFYANNIRWYEGGKTGLNGLTVSIRKGEILGLFGRQYCGKGALLHMLMGEAAPDSGFIFWNGVKDGPRPDAVRITQFPSLIDDLRIWENVLLLWDAPGKKRFFLTSGKRKLIRLFLEECGIGQDPDMRAEDLTLMEKICLECAVLSTRAQLMIVDLYGVEGTREEYRTLKDLLQRLAAQGLAVLVTSYQAEIILPLCERIAIIDNGRILKEFPADRTTSAELRDIMDRLCGIKNPVIGHREGSRDCVFTLRNARIGRSQHVCFSLYRGEYAAIVSEERDTLAQLRDLVVQRERRKGRRSGHGEWHGNVWSVGRIAFYDSHDFYSIPEEYSPTEYLCLGMTEQTGKFGLQNRSTMECLERDFCEWYGEDGLFRKGTCQELTPSERLALNLFRLSFVRADVLFCAVPSAYIDQGGAQMVDHMLMQLAGKGIAVCVVSSDLAYKGEEIERYIVLENVHEDGVLMHQGRD